MYTPKKIIPGQTLIFFDEIQECPDAIRYLRYFKEEMPELHVIAYSDPSQKGEFYYWHSESSTSNAEVDFVAIHHKAIVPIEVKSKVKGGMKSLNVFLSKHPNSPYGIKISEGMFSKQDHLREIPLYAVKNI